MENNGEQINVDEFVSFDGSEVKALGDGKVAGYLIQYGDENNTDISSMKDFFQSDTNFGRAKSSDVLYHHGLDVKIGGRVIGEGLLKMDELGVWIEAQLDMADEYEKAIYKLVEKGKLGWSSGTASHRVTRKKVGNAHKILTWPLGLDASLTPMPAEPRNRAISLKSITVEDIWSEAGEATSAKTSQNQSTESKGDTVEEETKEVKPEVKAAVEADAFSSAFEKVLAETKQQNEIKAQQARKQAEMEEQMKELAVEFMKSQPADNGGRSVHLNLKTKRGDDAVKAFVHFANSGDAGGIRTGEAYEKAMKTNYILTEGTQYQGQEVVPTEIYNSIVERRNALSVARAAGALVVNAKSNAINIPVEKADPQVWGITTIDGSNTFTTLTQQPIDKLAGTVYDFTYNIPITQNLMDDDVSGIDAWMPRYVGRGLALTENNYLLMGTGSGQPQGAAYASTLGVSLASPTAATAAEVIALYYKLASEYRDNVVWVMRGATESAVRGLTTQYPFPFVGNGGTMGAVGMSAFPQGAGWLVDQKSRVFNSDGMDAITAAKKPIVVGNFEAGYAIIDRKFLTVLRDPFSQANKGTINLWFHARFSGGVVNANAFYHALTATG